MDMYCGLIFILSCFNVGMVYVFNPLHERAISRYAYLKAMQIRRFALYYLMSAVEWFILYWYYINPHLYTIYFREIGLLACLALVTATVSVKITKL